MKNKCLTKVLEIGNTIKTGKLKISKLEVQSHFPSDIKDLLYNLLDDEQYNILCKMKEGQITHNEIRKNMKVNIVFRLLLWNIPTD